MVRYNGLVWSDIAVTLLLPSYTYDPWLRQTCDNDVLSARIGNRNIFIASIYLVEKFVRNRKKVVRKSNLGDK